MDDLNILDPELRLKVEEAMRNARQGADEELERIEASGKPKKERKKRGASEYNTFFKEHYKKVKEVNPDIKFSQASKLVSDAWTKHKGGKDKKSKEEKPKKERKTRGRKRKE